MPPHRRRSATPLYDSRFEHDACGVGFVADAGGRSRARVLPLALAGLAALAHRGAFGADGESSDGAGISLPLDASLLEALAPAIRRRIARPSSCCSCPGAAAQDGPRADSWSASSPTRSSRSPPGGPCRWTPARWAPRPPRPARPSPRRSSRAPLGAPPTRGPSPTMPSSAGSSSPDAAWRPPPGTPAVPWPSCRCRRRRAGRSSTRASSPVAAWPSCIRTCGRRSSSATRSSTSAMRRTPIRSGAWPSRSAPSPTTARSTPSAGTASRSADARATAAHGRSPPSSPPRARCSRRTAPIRCRSTRAWSC